MPDKEDPSTPRSDDTIDAFEKFAGGSISAYGDYPDELETADGVNSEPVSPPTDGAGSKVAGYTRVKKLGEGGFGDVWWAKQEVPVRREVALKILKPGVAGSADMVARFKAEGQALALMDHPNVAKVYDVGEVEDGRFFFAMELVGGAGDRGEFAPGLPLTDFCDAEKLGLKERLKLFGQVCRAIHHAHQKGVIHRDIKPSNILVGVADGNAVPKVIDFGIAKDTGAHLLKDTLYTETGQLIGTPQYMSPEQASGVPGSVDTRTDVYALGAVLFEILCGEPPISRETLRTASLEELLRMIREDDPPRPSAKVTMLGVRGGDTAIARGHSESRRLADALRGEPEWIAFRAMEKNPVRRHQSAGELAEDAEAFANGEPLPHSGPPSRRYRIKKFVHRHRGMVGAAAVTAILLIAGTAVSTWQAVRTMREKQEAQFQEGLGWIFRAEVAEERGHRYPDTLLYAAKAVGFEGFGRPEGADPADLPPLIREDRNPEEFEKARNWVAERPAYLPVWSSGQRPEEPVTALVIDPEGVWLALGSAAGVRMFDLASGANRLLPEVEKVTDLAVDPWGEVLAIAAGEKLWLWDLKKRFYREPPELPKVGVEAVAWSPGGDQLACGGRDGSILFWANGTGAAVRVPVVEGTTAAQLAFSPENAFVAAVYPSAGPRLVFPAHRAPVSAWQDLTAGREERLDGRDRAEFLARVAEAGRAICVAVSPDGTTLAVGTAGGGVTLWEASGAAVRGRVSPELRHDGPVMAVAFRPDGNILASASAPAPEGLEESGGDEAGDGTVKLWEVVGDRPELMATLAGHHGATVRLAFAPGGTLLASAGADGSAKLWDISGEAAGRRDLFAYVGKDGYGLKPAARWKAGAGQAAFGRKDLAGELRRDSGAGVEGGLLADAAAAAKGKRWSRFELRVEQLRRLGMDVPKTLQEAREAALPRGERVGDGFKNGEGVEMLWCPPGAFIKGESASPGAVFKNKISLSQGFWLGKFEVTQELYEKVMGSNPSTNIGSDPTTPVENLSWFEAVEFCQKLTDLERSRGTIRPGWEYALPTELMWEYAARAGTRTRWYFGDDESELYKYANFNDASGYFANSDHSQDDGHKYPAPVGSYLPNAWGFHDMAGNVAEWCRDSFVVRPVADPTSKKRLSRRVYRGGCYSSIAAECRPVSSFWDRPTARNNILGLRPALVQSSSKAVSEAAP